MKIVKGYTIAGQLLVQGHTDLVAKVGDIVRLYLDQVSDPELPEFIRATVETPIIPLQNGTQTSYGFSYDETLLDGAITRLRAKDIVDVLVYSTQGRSAYESYLITTDDDPVLTEAEWVANPNLSELNDVAISSPTNGQTIFRNGSNLWVNRAIESGDILPALSATDLEVASIHLTDGTGTQLSSGSVTLDAANNIVVHDGESNTEDLPRNVNSREAASFAVRTVSSAMSNAIYARTLLDIPIPSTVLTNGKLIHITGRTFAGWSPGTLPDGGIFLILAKEGSLIPDEGMNFQLAQGSVSELREFLVSMVVLVSDGIWSLSSLHNKPSSFNFFNDGTSIATQGGWDWGGEWSESTPVSGPVGEPVKLRLSLVTLDTAGLVTASLFTSGNLSIIFE